MFLHTSPRVIETAVENLEAPSPHDELLLVASLYPNRSRRTRERVIQSLLRDTILDDRESER